MSTKSTLTHKGEDNQEGHKLSWHVYKDMHQAEDTIVFELSCSTCYCHYTFLMDEHLGNQLAGILKTHE